MCKLDSYNEKIEKCLEKFKCVDKISSIKFYKNKIVNIEFSNRQFGNMSVKLLTEKNLQYLYDFYFGLLSEDSRALFPPYPLFKPALSSKRELLNRYNKWKTESDWFFWLLSIDEVIGVMLLKKLDWKNTQNTEYRSPTSGLAIAEKYQKKGFGSFLQKIIEIQAYHYGVNRLYVTVDQQNYKSIIMHKKAGYSETGRIIELDQNKKNYKKSTREIELSININENQIY